MDRESWLYVLAFLGIVAAGAWFIVPRLANGPRDEPQPVVDRPSQAERTPPVEPEPDVPSPPPPRRVTVVVRAAEGRFRGPLHAVVGAESEVLESTDAARGVRIAVTPRQARVAFGAVGHRWVEIGAESLADDLVVELEAAVAPLVVRVREADGSPASGVPVRVRPPVPGAALRTDAGGTVVLDHLPPGVVAVDLDTTERRGPSVRLLAGRDRDVTLVLDPPLEITGRIVDQHGAPIQGALVRGFGPVELGFAHPSDAAGRFTWRGPAVARIALRVTAYGRSPVRVAAMPPATGPLRRDLGDVVLAVASGTIQGTVATAHLDPEAYVEVEPEAAAVVREVFGDGFVLDAPRRVPIDRDGRFVLADVEADLPLRVGVRGAGVDLDQRVVLSPGATVEASLDPPAGWALHGRVLDPQGMPRAGVVLLVSSRPRDGDLPLEGDRVVSTGADGSFVLRGWGAPEAFVRAYVPGHRSLLARIAFPIDRGLDLRLEEALRDDARRVRGTIEDETGRPLPGVTVRAAGVVAETDATGAFTLEGVESLAPSVELTYGYEPGRPGDPEAPTTRVQFGREAVVPGAPPRRFVLPATGTLRMDLREGISEAPMAFVHVLARATRDGRVVVDRGVAPHAGRVVLSNLPAEGLEIALLAPGLRWTGTALVPPSAERDLGVVLLHRGVRARGVVVDERGQPIPGARIGLFDRGWQTRGADPITEREQLFRFAHADAEGRFVLDGLGIPRPHPLRKWREAIDLAVGAPGYAPQAVRVDFAHEPGPDGHVVNVTLEEGAFLGLDLTEHTANPLAGAGAPVFGAIVDLESGEDGANWLDLVQWGVLGGPVGDDAAWREASRALLLEARSDDGYLVGPVRPGPYELHVSRPGYAPFRQRLTIVPADLVLYRDLASGAEARFEGRRSYFRFALHRVR